jgi:hypothetical protein
MFVAFDHPNSRAPLGATYKRLQVAPNGARELVDGRMLQTAGSSGADQKT